MRASVFLTMVLVPFLGVGSPARAREKPRRPNFVFVYTDDQRWDAMSVVQREQGSRARFPWLVTPHFDRLASEGLRFRNAFVVHSLCSPSRAAFLTGRYGHENGIVNNHTPFRADSVTHASLARQAGYVTGYIGKWHMGSQRGKRPGFDFSASFVGQGRYVDCPFEVDGVETPTKGWVDDVSTDYAVRFLEHHKSAAFLLVVGFKSAHGPFDPPARHAASLADEKSRPVPNLELPPPYARGPGDANRAFALRNPDAAPTNLGYFRCLTAADDNLGRILDALDRLDLTQDTVVVFTSDNGFYLGEHRLGDKRSAYDESLRIPLLFRYPRMATARGTSDAMVLNIDLAPTFLDLAGIAPPASMQGKSWRPLLEGTSKSIRDAYFYSYFYERGFRIPMVTAVRTNTAKLIRYPGHDEWDEIFDLSADPYETRNLVNDPTRAALRRELLAEYERQKAAVDFRVPNFADEPTADRPAKALDAWVLDYRFDRDDGERVVDATRFGNGGVARGAPIVAGRNGRKARRFDGKGIIEVARTASLDPAVAGWTVEVVAQAEVEEGVILACGGRSQGYALHLVDGRPAFTVVSHGQTTRIVGEAPVKGRWATIRGEMSPDLKLRLVVDERTVGEGGMREPLATPADLLQVGGDLGSSVLGPGDSPRFVGLLESVRIHSGMAPRAGR